MTDQTYTLEVSPPTARYATARDYFELLKPRIMGLVVFTALVGLIAAQSITGLVLDPVLAVVGVLAVALGSGAAGAINMWYDADIDAVMTRTSTRPIPAGIVPREEALSLGLILSFVAVLLMWMATTVLAALDIGARNVASTWQQVADVHTEAVFKTVYRLTIPVMIALTAAVLYLFTSSFTAMLDLATSAVFLGAPVVAALNHRVVTRSTMPDEARPSGASRALSLLAIVVMTTLALAYFAL